MAEHVGWDQLAHAPLRRGGVLPSGGVPAPIPSPITDPASPPAHRSLCGDWHLAPLKSTASVPSARTDPLTCSHLSFAVRTGFFRARAVLRERGARVADSAPPRSPVGFFSLAHHLSFCSLSEQGWEVCCFVNCVDGSCPESEFDALGQPDWKGVRALCA